MGQYGPDEPQAGNGYSEEDLRAVLAGEKEHTPRKKPVVQAKKSKVNLLVDIQSKLQAGKGAGYSKKFLAEHEADILLHKAAKNAFNELNVKKLPTTKSLQAEYAELLAEKKKAYGEYRKARDAMRELQTVKANVDRVMGYESEKQDEKERALVLCSSCI